MKRLTIAIDLLLPQEIRPAIEWTWRLLLTGIGYAWQEVAADAPACDIAYAISDGRLPPSRLTILARPELWARPGGLQLDRLRYEAGWPSLHYVGDDQPTPRVDHQDGLVCARDLALDVFWLATGVEEPRWPKNRHGFVDLSGTAWQRERVLELAPASGIAARLQALLMQLGCHAPVPRWPHGRSAAAAVGHDVDYPEVIRWLEPLRILARRGRAGFGGAADVLLGRRTHWQFRNWVDLEQRYGVRSAFMFVARRGSLLRYTGGTPDPFYDVGSPRFRRLFEELAAAGVEIALHASYRATTADRLRAEKGALEEASGQAVRGNRHHYWHLDPRHPEATLRAHEAAGLGYDTSLTHDHYVGWRRGLAWPFFPFHSGERRGLRTLQIGTAWMDDQLFGMRR